MNLIEEKYLHLVSSQLEGFKLVNKNANFRCPVCGDSDHDKRKRRGWVLTNKDHGVFYCHNCGASMSFPKLLEFISHDLYREYVLDILKEKGKPKSLSNPQVKMPAPVFKEKKETNLFLEYFTPLDKLEASHSAVKYMTNRKMPTEKFKYIYWCDNMQNIKHFDVQKKYSNKSIQEGRIVFPFFNQKGGVTGLSARTLDPKNPKRYIIYKFTDELPLFGVYDRNGNFLLDSTKKVYVTEGAVDSLCINNAIAVNGGDLSRSFKFIENLGVSGVFVPDNEPRNKQIVAGYKKVINSGKEVCIFPKTVKEKDVNEMVINYGYQYVMELIADNVYSGMQGKLKLTDWKRC